MEKLVSVYMSAYNAEKYILESVNSVLNQSYKNIQLIVVDDCSTDKTLEILKSIKDTRLEIYKNPKNMHMAYSWNEGLKYAKGEYLAHIDADDVWLPDKLEKQVAFLEEHHEYGACFTGTDIIDENSTVANDRFLNAVKSFMMENMPRAKMFRFFIENSNRLCHNSCLIRSDIMYAIGCYDIANLFLNDFDCWLKVLNKSEIYIMPDRLTLSRQHSENNSTLTKEKLYAHDNELLRILNNAICTADEELFLEAFEDKLCFKGKHTKEEIELEKAFVLADCLHRYTDNPTMAIDKLRTMLNDPKYLKLSTEKFGFSLKELYKLQGKPSYFNISEIKALEDNNRLLSDKLYLTENHTKILEEKIEALNNTINQKDAEISALNNSLNLANNSYLEIKQSFFWRLTSPLRKISQKLKNFLSQRPCLLEKFIYLKGFLKGGFEGAKQKVAIYRWNVYNSFELPKNKISKAQRRTETKFRFDNDVKFSVIVPLYNTPKNFLEEMIDSVRQQTYANWELCLADGSDDNHSYVGSYCKKLAKKDKRIKYKKLNENKGISENTNACIEMSTGDYIALFDHDDILHPSVLFKYMKAICDQNADFIYCDEDKFRVLGEGFFEQNHKPDFSPDNLRSNNYICHFTVFKKELLEQVGMLRKKFDGSQDHDLVLRLTEKAEKIVHIPEILYHWRISDVSVASDPYAKPYTIEAGRKAVKEHLDRVGLKGTVESTVFHPNIYRIKYELNDTPLVSIIIPNCNHIDDLDKCVKSIVNKSSYKNYEIIIVENNSDPETFKYYETLKSYPQIKVVIYETNAFNYSAINNYGVKFASGEHLIFLNNDIEVITENWIEEMLMLSQRDDVGIVGAKLYFPDNTVQHAGVILGMGGTAAHGFRGLPRMSPGYFGRPIFTGNYSVVTFACAMLKRSVFKEIGGLDERLSVAYNDVDACLKARKAGYVNCFTPFAELYHYESKSRGDDLNGSNRIRLMQEANVFKEKWSQELKSGDPYYNPNLTLVSSDFSLKRLEEVAAERNLDFSKANKDTIASVKSMLRGFKASISRHPAIFEIFVFLKGFLKNGFKGGKQAIKNYQSFIAQKNRHTPYINKKTIKQQSKTKFNKDIKFSILVPLYNTPIEYLAEMINSVTNQTYKNWELCLADGSDKEHDYVGNYCLKRSRIDSRIKYKKLDKNKGISENTNECILMSTGNFIALFDHDDVLHPSALYEVTKAICEQNADFVYTDEAVFLDQDISNVVTYHFKPDFAFENLLANNYICHFSVFKASLIDKVGMFRHKYDGSQDHDMILRLTHSAENVVHIPKLLYFWRSHANSVAMDINSKSYAIDAGKSAVHDFLESIGIEADVESSPAFPTIYKINYKIIGTPKISILVPNKNNLLGIQNCIKSITKKSSYKNYEIIIVDNQSSDSATLEYYNTLKSSDNIKVISYDKPYNYSAMINLAAQNTIGDYLLLLDSDTEIITNEWLQELLMYAQRDTVGAVGAKLFKTNHTVQHGGIIYGDGEQSVAIYSHVGADNDNLGYMGKMFYSQNVSAVSSACLMVKKSDFIKVGGFDENQSMAYCDLDFCLSLRKIGLNNVFNPFCTLYHEYNQSYFNKEIYDKESETFKAKWYDTLEKGDPMYNPNFSLSVSYEII